MPGNEAPALSNAHSVLNRNVKPRSGWCRQMHVSVLKNMCLRGDVERKLQPMWRSIIAGASSEVAAARATEPRIWNYHWVVLEGLLIKSQRLDDVTRSLSHLLGWLDDSLMSACTEWPDNSGTKRDTGTARPSNGTQIKWLIENSQNTPFSKIKYYWCFVLSFSLGGRC